MSNLEVQPQLNVESVFTPVFAVNSEGLNRLGIVLENLQGIDDITCTGGSGHYFEQLGPDINEKGVYWSAVVLDKKMVNEALERWQNPQYQKGIRYDERGKCIFRLSKEALRKVPETLGLLRGLVED